MKQQLLLIGEAPPKVLEDLEAAFAVHKANEVADWDDFLGSTGSAITAVCTNGHDGLEPAIMAKLENLKVISCFGVGYDAIDAEAAAKRGIIVTHTPDVLNKDVANTAITLLLAVTRRIVRDDAYVRAGKWTGFGSTPLTHSIEGKTIGILGLGRIGQTIAQKLEAGFDCKIAYHARNERQDVDYRYYADLVEMAGDVEFLIVITPGGAATNKLVNRDVIEALGPTGTLVNVARGSVVDEAALVSALLEGKLGAAGLDVFENEPEVPTELFALDNVVLTPHIGSATVETRIAMGDLTVENLVRYFDEGRVTTPVPECVHLNRKQ